MVFWNGGLINKIATYAMDGSGGTLGGGRFIGGNQRCVRLSGSASYLLYGHTGYFGSDGRTHQTFLTRGNCSMPNYASYGAILDVTDETCACYNGIRGNAALIPYVPGPMIDDDHRLSMPVSTVAQASIPAESPIVQAFCPLGSDGVLCPIRHRGSDCGR